MHKLGMGEVDMRGLPKSPCRWEAVGQPWGGWWRWWKFPETDSQGLTGGVHETAKGKEESWMTSRFLNLPGDWGWWVGNELRRGKDLCLGLLSLRHLYEVKWRHKVMTCIWSPWKSPLERMMWASSHQNGGGGGEVFGPVWQNPGIDYEEKRIYKGR
jgi:hypothetical protein